MKRLANDNGMAQFVLNCVMLNPAQRRTSFQLSFMVTDPVLESKISTLKRGRLITLDTKHNPTFFHGPGTLPYGHGGPTYCSRPDRHDRRPVSRRYAIAKALLHGSKAVAIQVFEMALRGDCPPYHCGSLVVCSMAWRAHSRYDSGRAEDRAHLTLMPRTTSGLDLRTRVAPRPAAIIHVDRPVSALPDPSPIRDVQQCHVALPPLFFDQPFQRSRHHRDLWTLLPNSPGIKPRGSML